MVPDEERECVSECVMLGGRSVSQSVSRSVREGGRERAHKHRCQGKQVTGWLDLHHLPRHIQPIVGVVLVVEAEMELWCL